jgi:formylglycine-generating enzyme required for sulfatase activity
MGSPNSEEGRFDDERPHRVTISQGFWMGKYEVTQGQWKAVMGTAPFNFSGDDMPAENVSWNDAQEFIKKLNALDDSFIYRLPTEAEWEYAARAGTNGQYAGNLDDMAWYYSNSGNKMHPVGTKKPNAWGLYDMHGNVWEWVQDWYGTYSNNAETDPKGPSTGSVRVYRGGNWAVAAKSCRSAYRAAPAPDARGLGLGFRLIRTPR